MLFRSSCPSPLYVELNPQRAIEAFTYLLQCFLNYCLPASAVSVLGLRSRDHAVILLAADRGEIPARDLPRLFDTLGPAIAGVEDSGPRLALARRIIEAFGGEISAENISGGGFRFQVRLPMAAEVSRTTAA